MQGEKTAMMHQSHISMVNPVSSPIYGAPVAPMSAPIFPSSLRFGSGASGLLGGRQGLEMDFMFSKRLTQSDVGKLNRLLIPRKEAERFFPMVLGAVNGDATSILCFEDSTGDKWHFCYSYWKSSKTYVLTKGWIRFVKEKKLIDGDTLFFYQRSGEDSKIMHMYIYFKKHDHVSFVPHTVPPLFGTLNDSWLRKAFISSSHYTSNLGWKPVSHGSMGATPANLPILQPSFVPQVPSLGSGVGPAKKRLRLFGVDILTNAVVLD
ncbi:hypothetical protein EJB05_21769, partial [Eragrostis curvula]